MSNQRTLIIAEAGVNHNGNIDMALSLVDAAADAGADVVKFQTFKATAIASETAPKAGYQLRTTDEHETQLHMLRKLELSTSGHRKIAQHCLKRKIEFLSTPFDTESLRFLITGMQVGRVKVPSGEITNGPLLVDAGRAGLPIILSTGMSLLGEIEHALMLLSWSMLNPNGHPNGDTIRATYLSPEGAAILARRVTLLHCTTEYPAAPADVNLKSISALRHAFGLPVGFSDHSVGTSIPVAAVALGAVVVEKHFTLDRGLPGPDHSASLSPNELREMVSSIRDIENAMGNGSKRPTAREEANRMAVRKSLVATQGL